MMLEGSRHEKVIIAVAAYIIGFVTALIAFGLHDEGPEFVAIIEAERQGSQMAAVAGVVAERQPSVMDEHVAVEQDSDGLHVYHHGQKRTISGKRTVLQLDDEPAVGFHADVHGAAVSPNDEYVYYCEQLSDDAEVCEPLVYSLTEDMIYRVRTNGDVLSLNVAAHDVAWTPGGRLQSSSAVSTNVDQPWFME